MREKRIMLLLFKKVPLLSLILKIMDNVTHFPNFTSLIIREELQNYLMETSHIVKAD